MKYKWLECMNRDHNGALIMNTNINSKLYRMICLKKYASSPKLPLPKDKDKP